MFSNLLLAKVSVPPIAKPKANEKQQTQSSQPGLYIQKANYKKEGV